MPKTVASYEPFSLTFKIPKTDEQILNLKHNDKIYVTLVKLEQDRVFSVETMLKVSSNDK